MSSALLCCLALIVWLLRHQWPESFWSSVNAPPEDAQYVSAIAFGPDGNTVASVANDTEVLLWRLHDKEILSRFRHHKPVREVHFSSDGSILVACASEEGVHVWSTKTGESEGVLWHVQGLCAGFGDAPNTLITGGDDGITFWDLQAKLQVTSVPFGRRVTAIALAKKRGLVFCGCSDGAVYVVDQLTVFGLRAEPHWSTVRIDAHSSIVNALRIDLDERLLVSVGADRRLQYWEPDMRKAFRVIAAHEGEITCVDVSRGGTLVATGGADGMVRVWNAARSPEVYSLRHEASVRSVALDRGAKVLLSGSVRNTIYKWDLSNGALIEKCQLR
jgi:WD40 repeat protein